MLPWLLSGPVRGPVSRLVSIQSVPATPKAFFAEVQGKVIDAQITWNYTTALNILFTLVAAALIGLTMRRGAHDPVCGMTVDRRKAQTTEHGGKRYFLCWPGCRAKFEANPDSYAARGASPDPARFG